MSPFSSMYGSHHMPGRIWRPKVEVSQDNVGMVPPEELRIDPTLPALGTDIYDPAHIVVIPSGRFVSIGTGNARFSNTGSGKTPVTLHDGKVFTPAGFSINQMYRDSGEFMTDSNTVKFRRGFVAEVPYVTGINEAHGALKAGDALTGYWGSTESTSEIAYIHRGKPVKWNAKKMNVSTDAASAIQILAAAIYPGITPRVVAAYTSGGSLLPAVTSTVSWSAGASAWISTFAGTGSATVATVMYEYGQDEDQIAGEVLRIQSVEDILDRDDFLKWVEYAPFDFYNYPPSRASMQKYPVTRIGTGSDPDVNSDWETPSTVTSGKVYRTAERNLSVQDPVYVAFKGTLVDKDGQTLTYADWHILPTYAVPSMRGFFSGLYHNVNWRTGVIELSSNIVSVSAIKVAYAYQTNPRDGAVRWATGLEGLTDGRNVTVNGQPAVGLQPHLNLSDVVASMRLIVR
jgi:hypothetical protein